VRVVPYFVIVAALCFGPLGCATFGKRNTGGERAAAASDKNNPPVKTAAPGDPLLGQTSNPTYGAIWGNVVDSATGTPIVANILYECTEEGKGEKGGSAALTAKDGSYYIGDLKPGVRYKLTARASQGSIVLVGFAYAKAPASALMIKLQRDLTGTAPPPDPPGVLPGDKNDPLKDSKKKPEPSAALPTPAIGAVAIPQQPDNRGFTIHNPQPGSGAVPKAPESGWQPNIVQNPPTWPPTADIPNPQRIPTPPSALAPTAPRSASTAPACFVAGNRIHHLVLPDLSSRGMWSWSSDRRGKLVLLDLWRTNCVPCIQTIPKLKALQDRYGSAGLEVIGLACQQGGTIAEQEYQVAIKCQQLQTNYRILLASDSQTNVVRQLDVRSLPTLILVDETGTIRWRHEGALDTSDQSILERQIATGLGVPR
jgi:thiol-disulfide isomerase/thioredoxin